MFSEEMEEFSLDGFSNVVIYPYQMLYERRRFLGLTCQAVADRAGIPLQSYQQFESGKRNILTASFRIACRVLEALEMDIVEFYHGAYSIGEPTYMKDGKRYYTANGRSADDAPPEG